MSELTNRYLDCWNEKDAVTRRGLVGDVFADNARYVDPMVDVTGADGIDATIAAVQAQFPDFVFAAIGDADAHHDQVRFTWGLGPAGAEPLVVGFDVAVLDTDGRIHAVYGFLDKVPAAA